MVAAMSWCIRSSGSRPARTSTATGVSQASHSSRTDWLGIPLGSLQVRGAASTGTYASLAE